MDRFGYGERAAAKIIGEDKGERLEEEGQGNGGIREQIVIGFPIFAKLSGFVSGSNPSALMFGLLCCSLFCV